MALIQCRECGKSISTEATACPQCGAPVKQIAPQPPLPQNRDDKEETIHSDSEVTVTTMRVIIHGTTYALRNITSVRMTSTRSGFGCAVVLLICLVIFPLFFALFAISASVGIGFFALIVAAAIIAWQLRRLQRSRTTYHVAISSASGEAKALSSKDQAYIQNIVKSINDAIVKYQ